MMSKFVQEFRVLVLRLLLDDVIFSTIELNAIFPENKSLEHNTLSLTWQYFMLILSTVVSLYYGL